MINDLKKQLDAFARMQASSLRQFDKAIKEIQASDPEMARKLMVIKEHAQSGKADPHKILEEVLKLAQK